MNSTCLVLVLAFAARLALGALGDDGDQLTNRFGKPVSQTLEYQARDSTVRHENTPDQKGHAATLEKRFYVFDSFKVRVILIDGISQYEEYTKVASQEVFLDLDIKTKLKSNSFGNLWEPMQCNYLHPKNSWNSQSTQKYSDKYDYEVYLTASMDSFLSDISSNNKTIDPGTRVWILRNGKLDLAYAKYEQNKLEIMTMSYFMTCQNRDK